MSEMANVEDKEEIKEIEEKSVKRVLIPEICMYDNKESTGYIMEVILPGVEKEDVKVKMNKDNLVIYGESDNIKYGGVFQLCCPVDHENAKSTYNNGLLKIEVPYIDELKDIIEVKIE
ncbi:hypothetical protein LCGC14_1073170 [marine sediment metagenome]|uniref:SHSP domain-containing protein n=1 Tax=marine sediment metagenome TaxID=412755 RepID=A0A0F9MHH5_9ZZZZ|nr:MAG: Hsp20/alpha crystallin family protein [Candidatus Lokiarchaeum sp. GC14_75]